MLGFRPTLACFLPAVIKNLAHGWFSISVRRAQYEIEQCFKGTNDSVKKRRLTRRIEAAESSAVQEQQGIQISLEETSTVMTIIHL